MNLERLIPAFESEKQYLMGNVLCQWAVQQQKISIAAQWTQQKNYNLLETIDMEFEYFGELLEQTLSGLSYLIEQYPNIGFEDNYGKIRQLTHLFLFYSIIVSRQPPSVVVKCGEAENHRRSRFWFKTEIRILGGRAFGIHKCAENNTQVQCHLITDETAKKLRLNAYYEISNNEHFIIEPSVSTLKSVPVNPNYLADPYTKKEALLAKVAKKEQLRREEVWKKRYHLCYNLQIKTDKHGIELIGKKVSLPFAILVGPKWDVEAKLFLERSFADYIRRPDSEPPSTVGYIEMADALEMKFQAILETPQKSTEQISLVKPKPFILLAKQHLINRLKPDQNGQILMPVAEEYCIKRSGINQLRVSESNASQTGSVSGRRTSSCSRTNSNASTLPPTIAINGASTTDSTAGEWKLINFYEWFFKLAELAEQLLSECHRPTMLIRFSDIEFGKIKISVKDNYGVIRHHWYDNQDLIARSLKEELLHNVKYRDIECIYPETNLESAIGARDVTNAIENRRKPRHLQPSPIYFTNQEPAMRLNSF